MNVNNILATKPVEGVIMIPPDTRLADAAALLVEKRIGAVVISATGDSIEGIISERDIVRELARRGPACLDLSVSHAMTRRLTTCTPGDTAQSVLSRMTEGRFRHMPVMDGTKMIGIISIGDVVKARLDDLAMEKDALESMIMGF